MKCFRCTLHFIALTDDEVEFIQQDVRCPECGALGRGIFANMELVDGYIKSEMSGEPMGTLYYLKEENPQKVQALRSGRSAIPVLARTSRSEFRWWRRPIRAFRRFLS